jgi:hypothetical protein
VNVDVPGARAAITGNNPVNARTSNAVLGEMKSIQQNVMNLVRSADAKKPVIAGSHHGVESETVTAGGSLKLSSFTKQISAESERDRKIAQLSPELFEQLNNKRKQLELVRVPLVISPFKLIHLRRTSKIAKHSAPS